MVGQVLGPLGALVILIVIVVSLVRGQLVVPKYIFEAEQKRCGLVEIENTELNESVKDLIVQNAELKGSSALLTAQIEKLREEVETLREQLKEAPGSS